MSHPEDSSLSGGSRRISSATCKPLLDAATPEMFRVNAFRVTGLAVDATPRAINKRSDEIKMMEELGQGKESHTGALALKTPPTVDQIRDAIQRLKDPEQRIIDEFFWFWPREFGQSAADPAIKALEGGDADTAYDIWKMLETSPTEGHVAMHNVAVLRHLMALEWENHFSKAGELTKENRHKTEKLWRSAFKRWEILVTDDLFWQTVSGRIKQLDDPRLTSGFARRMRATLPHALDKINAELAVRYAESGRMDVAQVHVQFMRDTNQGLDDVEKTVELALAPTTTWLKQQIQHAKEHSEVNPSDAGNKASFLLENAKKKAPIFDLFSAGDNEGRNILFDEVAEACSILLVMYRKATDDVALCLRIGPALLKFVTSPELRRQIEENIGVWNEMKSSQELEPVYSILKTLQDSKESPSVRLRRFNSEAAPAISAVISGIHLSQGYEARIDLENAAAVVLRGISLAAWNEHQDFATATSANTLAQEYVKFTFNLRRSTEPDPKQEMLKLLMHDETLLSAMQSTRRQPARKSGAGCLVLIAIVALISIFDSLGSKKSSTTSSYPASSVSTPSPYVAPTPSPSKQILAKSPITGTTQSSPPLPNPDFSITPSSAAKITPVTYTPPVNYTPLLSGNKNSSGTYRVPISKTPEIDAERQAIDREKEKSAAIELRLNSAKQYLDDERSELEALKSQLRSLSDQVEISRKYLDKTSQDDVDEFNSEVNRYNIVLAKVRAQNERTNRAVDRYNSILEDVRTQDRVVNALVDAYNTKLHLYAR